MKSEINFYIFVSIIFCAIFVSVNSCIPQTEDISEKNKYAVAVINTPVLNTEDFESVFGGVNGNRVKLDKKGLIREMEFIAFPGTVFEILEVIPKEGYNIYRVTTEDYPYYSSDIFIDSRFTKTTDTLPPERPKTLPDKKKIIANINSLEGYPYMWGGNCGEGIDQLLEFYRPKEDLQQETLELWKLKGVDCSGLVYQATNGATPRNTSSLINYGKGIDIEGLDASQIAVLLKPLDLIVWSGHVIIVLDDNTVIESTPAGGVHKSDLLTRLNSVLNERTPVNDWGSTKGNRFVVRRWISEN
ncbi:MAG: peptidoglycan endopeptidase [Ignavibacteria bacterium]|nr:peptidoglycan endopeptidase [Ignavibacteria bacterium]